MGSLRGLSLIVNKMRRLVAKIHTLSWKVCLPAVDTEKILGTVLRGSDGDCTMQVIFQRENTARRDPRNPKGDKGGLSLLRRASTPSG